VPYSSGGSTTLKLKLVLLLAVSVPGLASAAGGPSHTESVIASLIRAQTDAFAQASDRQDEAAMNALLADEVLFSGGDGAIQRDPQYDRNDATSQLLRRQTKSFRDADRRGDLVAAHRYLDREFIDIDAEGELRGEHDFQSGASSVSAIPSTVELKEWVVHESGDAAVTSYIEEDSAKVGNAVFKEKHLAVDTWVQRAHAWKLLSSQRIQLNDDPAALAPSQDLDAFTGTYAAGESFTVSITRDAQTLYVANNGGKPSALIPLASDVFVRAGTPTGYPRPLIVFQRNTQGRVSGYRLRDFMLAKRNDEQKAVSGVAPSGKPPPSTLVLRDFVVHEVGDVAVATFLHDRTTDYGTESMHQTYRSSEVWVKRDDGWKMLASQGHELLAEPQAVTLSDAQLDGYTGTYSTGGSIRWTLSREGHSLLMIRPDGTPLKLSAEAADCFVLPGHQRTVILFQHGAAGQVSGYQQLRDGRALTFAKIRP
jgi:ketosteroid isomerase-like protein